LEGESSGDGRDLVPRPQDGSVDGPSSEATRGVDEASDQAAAPGAGSREDAPRIERELLLELNELVSPKSSWKKNIGVLIVSVLLFFGLGLADEPLSGIIIITLALFVHEMGHVLGMKLLGYRNVSMLFIPFLGAAVSGKRMDAPGWKRAVVTFMGPLAGLAAAFALFIVWLRTAESLAWRAALTCAILNLFNLLPLYPLDGGRFLQEVLFSRSRYLDAFFRVLMTGLLVTVAVWLGAWILAAVGVFVILGTGAAFKTAIVAKRLRAVPEFPRVVDPDGITAETVIATRDELRRVFPVRAQPKVEASLIWQVWQKLNARPPGAAASAGLVLLYLLTIVAAPVAAPTYLFLAAEESVVETPGPDGTMKMKLVSHAHAILFWEAELNEKGLYHGKSVDYTLGVKDRESTWRDGLPDGEWVSLGADGEAQVTVVFERGEFVFRRDTSPDGVREWKHDQLPAQYRALVDGIRARGPYGAANRFGLTSEVMAPPS